MEKTIKLEIPESQAKKFESLLDKTLEILNRLEVEAPKRDKRKKFLQKNIDKNIAETQKNMSEIDKTLKEFAQR